MTEQEKYDMFVKYFERVSHNPIFFLEKFYNEVADEDKRVHLTDEQKQDLFDRHRAVPLIKDMNDFVERQKKIDELKAQGKKDWEIF